MEYLKQVHDFATKWVDKFRDQKINYIELVDHYMADDCEALGFQMDCGHAFSEKYGNAASKYDELNRIIDEVSDIGLLGSAIYSQWRYFNHWAMAPARNRMKKSSNTLLSIQKDGCGFQRMCSDSAVMGIMKRPEHKT